MIELHTPFESCVVHTWRLPHTPLGAHDLPPADEVDEHATARMSAAAAPRRRTPLMTRTYVPGWDNLPYGVTVKSIEAADVYPSFRR